MKAAFLFLSMVILLSSCNKSVDKQAVDEQLVGSWEWIRSDGGIGYNIHDTPASTGINKTITLNANSTYVITINNVLFSKGAFSIQSKQCIHDGEKKSLIKFEHDAEMMVESLDPSILILSDEVYDGVDSEYHRAGTNEPE